MLSLVFVIGRDRYALDVRQVVEVLPLVELTPVPGAPAAIAGLFKYRGALVPVVDLSHLTLGRAAARRLSTRIVLVHYPGRSGQVHLLGLICERATETSRRDQSEFVSSGVISPAASHLGAVTTDEGGVLQSIDVRSLLPPSLRDLLFTQPTGEEWGLPT